MSEAIETKFWESLCNKCGKCCYEKHNFGIVVIADPERPCKYLVNNSCSIYEDRLTINPSCGEIKSYGLLVNGVLPKECGYIHIRKEYIPCIFPRDMDHFWEIIEKLSTEISKEEYEFWNEEEQIISNAINFKEFVIKLRKKRDE